MAVVIVPRRIAPGPELDPVVRKQLSDLQDAVHEAFRRLKLHVDEDGEDQDTSDTPRPRLTYVSASQINVAAMPGESAEVRRTLQDGRQRTFSGLLTWLITASGEGGLDTGSEAASTWYYLYLVPSAASDDRLVLIGSIVSPASGGPTGKTNFDYLGAVRNDGGSNLVDFVQFDASGFLWCVEREPASTSGFGTTAQAKAAVSVADTVPATASMLKGNYVVQKDAGGGEAHIYLYVRNRTSPITSLFANAAAFVSDESWYEIPLPTSPKEIEYESGSSGGAGINYQKIFITGWFDGYL